MAACTPKPVAEHKSTDIVEEIDTIPTSMPAPEVTWETKELDTPGVVMSPIKVGPSPLVYLVESDAVIRIVDMEGNKTLAEGPAQAREIVSIDDRLGVRIGEQVLVKGPLGSGRNYGIYVLTGEGSAVRRGRERRRPMPRPDRDAD
jgi:hypothetical protein